jgi:DNA helicase HerA-like ATPase
MADRNAYTDKIKASYAAQGQSMFLGCGVLNNEVIADARVQVPLRMMNRHGLIAGATGTGKTRTLQVLAEHLSDNGVPVFLLDVKGDLSGISKAAEKNPKIDERIALLGAAWEGTGFPVEIYSLSGKTGAQMRATVTEFGPILLSKILELNETQTGVMAVLFKYADDHKMPIVDFNDLKKILSYLSEGDGAKEIKDDYGKISSSTSGTILRKIVALEQQGVGHIFGETSFDIDDLFEKVDGKGVISLLNISDTQDKPALYSTFLLSLLVEIYQAMPEAGDLDKPKLVFFFDEAHLLFKDAPKAFLEQIEQIVRLIRSKGVGVFFCTQSPLDVPDTVLGQLGTRIQHALRAFTPNDADNLKKTARTYPKSEFYEIETVLTSLGIGQAMITTLTEKGIPTEPAAVHLYPPRSVMGPVTPAEHQQLLEASEYYKKYKEAVDPESAAEMLTKRVEEAQAEQARAAEAAAEEKAETEANKPRKNEKSTIEKVVSNPVTQQLGKSLVRGLMGMLFGGSSSGRKSTRRKKSSFF